MSFPNDHLTLDAASPEELLIKLGSIAHDVPPRGIGRTHDHCERWSISRFLTTYSETELFDYPLCAEHGDRPDLRLRLAGEREIGVEITEAVPPDWARVCALNNRRYPDAAISMIRFRPEGPARSPKEIRAIASGAVAGSAWEGDSAESDWADAMMYRLERKAKALTEDGFDRFAEDWLIIYDNWPLPAVDLQQASIRFSRMIDDLSAPPTFQHVFVESGDAFWRFGAGTFDCASMPARRVAGEESARAVR